MLKKLGQFYHMSQRGDRAAESNGLWFMLYITSIWYTLCRYRLGRRSYTVIVILGTILIRIPFNNMTWCHDKNCGLFILLVNNNYYLLYYYYNSLTYYSHDYILNFNNITKAIPFFYVRINLHFWTRNKILETFSVKRPLHFHIHRGNYWG